MTAMAVDEVNEITRTLNEKIKELEYENKALQETQDELLAEIQELSTPDELAKPC